MSYVGSYLWQLREVLGTRRLLTPGVAIILTDPDGKIWCGKRTNGGEWSYIGGAMELGQSIEDCLRTELKEETTLDLETYRLAGILSHPDATNYTYPNGDEVQIVNFVFEVPRNGREMVLDEEHSAFAAFDPRDLPEPFKADSRRGVELYLRFLETGTVQVA